MQHVNGKNKYFFLSWKKVVAQHRFIFKCISFSGMYNDVRPKINELNNNFCHGRCNYDKRPSMPLSALFTLRLNMTESDSSLWLQLSDVDCFFSQYINKCTLNRLLLNRKWGVTVKHVREWLDFLCCHRSHITRWKCQMDNSKCGFDRRFCLPIKDEFQHLPYEKRSGSFCIICTSLYLPHISRFKAQAPIIKWLKC